MHFLWYFCFLFCFLSMEKWKQILFFYRICSVSLPQSGKGYRYRICDKKIQFSNESEPIKMNGRRKNAHRKHQTELLVTWDTSSGSQTDEKVSRMPRCELLVFFRVWGQICNRSNTVNGIYWPFKYLMQLLIIRIPIRIRTIQLKRTKNSDILSHSSI